MSEKQKISLQVAELFAGVGGFRLGLESAEHKTVWANQWEPKTKVQHAYECYRSHFGDVRDLNTDIYNVDKKSIPDHNLLVGGFPCQDYSVATTRAKGMKGVKGVLWWSIRDTILEKRPDYILLENVDRLLKSPVKQRGRDFGIILSCLFALDYSVEWRVINASEYGFPQKRRRVFIFGCKKGTDWYNSFSNNISDYSFLAKKSFFSKEFPVENERELSLYGNIPNREISTDIQSTSDNFSYSFSNSGVMHNGEMWSKKLIPVTIEPATLRSVLIKDADESFYISKESISKWEYLKDSKREERTRKDGTKFFYIEGAIPYPDNLDTPSRTIITSEGGLTPSRFKHLIQDPWTKKLRVLTPEEVEKLNGFPTGWTEGMPINWRYFCMGNALVVGIIEKMGRILARMA